MAQKTFNLQPPLAGLNKKTSFKQKPPFATPSCSNVRPTDSVQQRSRIGSRPGLGKEFFEQLGSGNPINMLADISIVKANANRIWVDSFNGSSIDAIWSTPSWITNPPTIIQDGGTVSTYNTEGGLVRAALSPFVVTSEYNVELLILPYLGEHWGRYQIFVSMDNTTPAINTEGVLCEITITGSTGAYTSRVVDITAGVGTETTGSSGTIGAAAPVVMQVVRNGTNTKLHINGTQLASVTCASHTNKRIGFAMYTTVADGVCLVGGFRIQYAEGIYTEIPNNILCAASNGSLYTNSTYVNKMTAVSSNLTLASSPYVVQAVDRYQKLYIADYSDVVTKQTDGVVSSATIDSASVSDWTAIGLNIYDYVCVITAGTGPTAGVYNIQSIASGAVTLTASPGNGTAISFYFQRVPKIYDPIAGSLTAWTATTGKGMLPIGSYCVCLYRDRMVMALDHLYYMSRQGDPLDWDYGQTDVQRAVAGQTSEAGMIAQRIQAVVPHGDDYLIFLCSNSIWRMRGDPTYGGQVDNISKFVGCVDKQAYCMTPEGQLIFLSLDGIYGLVAAAGQYPMKISKNNLPNELKKINNKLFNVSMSYDIDYNGIHIYVTPKTGGLGTHWFFDWENKGFWPVALQTTHQPYTCMYYVSSDTDSSGVLLGSKDGYLRKYDSDNETDDGTEIDSSIVYGPLATWDDYHNGRVEEIITELSRDSGQVHYQLLKGSTAQENVENFTIFSSGAIPLAGLNYKYRPKMKSEYWALKLSNEETDRRWSVENITIATEQAGTKRKL